MDEQKRQSVVDALRWLGYTASADLLERDSSWLDHFVSLLSNQVRLLTDEQRLAIWPHWTERP
jgi:hypothetical protein